MPRPWRSTALALATSAMLWSCAPAHTPLLGTGPFAAADRLELVDVVRAAQLAGYHPTEIDPVHGRFVLASRRDARHGTRFVVRCTQELFVVIIPEGSNVEFVDGDFRMPSAVAEEYAQLAVALEAGLGARIGLR